MTICTCIAPQTPGPLTCGWCGILPKRPAMAPAPISLAARLAPALENARCFERLAADESLPLLARQTMVWLASEARESMRSSAGLWAIGVA